MKKNKPKIGKKLFANQIHDKGLLSKIYEMLSKFNNIKLKENRNGPKN